MRCWLRSRRRGGCWRAKARPSANDLGTVIENANGEIEALKYSDDDAMKSYEQGMAKGREEAGKPPQEFYDADGAPRWHASGATSARENAARLHGNEPAFIDDIAGQTLWREPTEKQGKWLLSIFIRLGGRKAR